MGRLVIDGGDVYELDENCLREKRREEEQKKFSRRKPENQEKDQSRYKR